MGIFFKNFIMKINRFIRSLDNSKDGIRGKMDYMNNLLKHFDLEVWENLEKLGIDR